MISAGFFDPAAADAGSTDFHSFGGSVFFHTHTLNVGFKGTGRYFHHVHTDTALFFGKTSADDPGTVGFLFTANFANIAHFTPLYLCCIFSDIHPFGTNNISHIFRKASFLRKIFENSPQETVSPVEYLKKRPQRFTRAFPFQMLQT
jgi:hypothetical protein